jgi:hypothetical protein
MQITDAKWIDADHTGIVATFNDVRVFVPSDPSNRHYAFILSSGVMVAEADTED